MGQRKISISDNQIDLKIDETLECFFASNINCSLGFLDLSRQILFRVTPLEDSRRHFPDTRPNEAAEQSQPGLAMPNPVLIFTHFYDQQLKEGLERLSNGRRRVESMNFDPDAYFSNKPENGLSSKPTDLVDNHLDEHEIFIRESGWLKRIFINDIDWIKLEGVYTHLFCANIMHTLRKTSSQVLEKLPVGLFCQIHKSYYVNVEKIEAMNHCHLKIGKEILPIGRTFYRNLLQILPHLEC